MLKLLVQSTWSERKKRREWLKLMLGRVAARAGTGPPSGISESD